MYMIIGLGNPEKKYNNTRHNIGFDAIDELAKRLDINVTSLEHKAMVGKGFMDGQRVILAKPLTYMNLSGESVRALTDYYNVDPQGELLIIYDDVSMPVGQLRIRKKGSAGGHNGIKSIIAHLGNDAFWRIKVGVGAPGEHRDMVSHVLGHFTEKERKEIDEALKEVSSAAALLSAGDTDKAMNLYNKKKDEALKKSEDVKKNENLKKDDVLKKNEVLKMDEVLKKDEERPE